MNSIASQIFKYRSYTPLPFLVLMIIFQQPSIATIVSGFILVLTGESFRLWGVIYAGSETRTTGDVGGTYLVISGAFGHVRNPLYFGNILIYLGVGIMSWALFPYLQIAALLFFLFQYHLIIKEEEGYLEKTFGEEYLTYKKKVPRLIPSPVKYKSSKVEQPPLNLAAGLRSEKRTLQAIAVVTIIIVATYLARTL
jgi:protein-S-isoprenylcysteine O-methyltransferase Ste14